MKHKLFVLTLLIISAMVSPAPIARAAASLELYGTFSAMGVIVTIAASDDPDNDMSATVEYRASGATYRA